MPSEYELDRNKQRNSDRQQRVLTQTIAIVRKMVEQALTLNQEKSRIAQRVSDYDTNKDGFRQRAEADRRDWLLLWVFWGTILAYTVLEFMTSGDVAEMLACQMAPHFGIDPATGAIPIWLRRAAGVGFVTGMLLATLLVKLISGWFLGAFKVARAGLTTGEDGSYRKLSCAIWGIYLSKVAYVGAVAALYVWLFGFAQQRAEFMTDMAAEQKQASEWSGLGFSMEGGAVKGDADATAKPGSTETSKTLSRLSGATGVFYAIIVLLHALVLLLPASGFSRELELANFKRGEADKTVNALREEEQSTLRAIYEHVRIAPEQHRGDLVEASEPVHGAINQLYGRRIIGIAGIEPNTPANSSAAPGNEGPEMPASPQSPFSPTGGAAAHAANGNGQHSPVYANGSNGTHPVADDEAASTDWDAIFPTRRV